MNNGHVECCRALNLVRLRCVVWCWFRIGFGVCSVISIVFLFTQYLPHLCNCLLLMSMSKLDHSSKSHTHSYVSFHSLFIVFLRPHHCRCCLFFFTCVPYFLIVRPRNVLVHTPFVYMIVNNLADCVKQIFMGLLEQPNNKRTETERGERESSTKRTNRNGKSTAKRNQQTMIVRGKTENQHQNQNRHCRQQQQHQHQNQQQQLRQQWQHSSHTDNK